METDLVRELSHRGAHFHVIHHVPAHASIQEAVAIGAPPGDVLKTVVLDTSSGHALAVIPANRQLDLARVRSAVGDEHAHLASEQEIQHDLPGCELGSVPPFGSILGLPVYVDPEVLSHRVVVFPVGDSSVSIRGETEELFAGENVTVTLLARRDPEPFYRN